MSDDQVAGHPVWGSDNEAIKAEFRALQERCDKYRSWFDRADAEAERLQVKAEEAEARIGELVMAGSLVEAKLKDAEARNQKLERYIGEAQERHILDKARLRAADELADAVEDMGMGARADHRLHEVFTAYREASK
jgi:chromosome segregation ATPase